MNYTITLYGTVLHVFVVGVRLISRFNATDHKLCKNVNEK